MGKEGRKGLPQEHIPSLDPHGRTFIRRNVRGGMGELEFLPNRAMGASCETAREKENRTAVSKNQKSYRRSRWEGQIQTKRHVSAVSWENPLTGGAKEQREIPKEMKKETKRRKHDEGSRVKRRDGNNEDKFITRASGDLTLPRTGPRLSRNTLCEKTGQITKREKGQRRITCTRHTEGGKDVPVTNRCATFSRVFEKNSKKKNEGVRWQ